MLISTMVVGQKTNTSINESTVYPTTIKTPVGFSVSKPLRDAPVDTTINVTNEEFYMNKHRDREINPNIKPPDFKNMPADPGEQTTMGSISSGRGLDYNYAGQNSGSYPPDCNGTVNSDYYFQVVNTTYQIFNKSDGSTAAGPSNLNTIFNTSLPGASCNSGDPIVLWDEQADRWLYSEFSLCGSNDYMLIAVSTTNDPTGTWYSWSFDVADTPDYMKFGIWQDGYYMSTNTGGGNDTYVFERDEMIAGNSSPTMIAFDNPNRPSTFDGFHCMLPLDNDGPWSPTGTPGQFITIADDGQSNAADELRIFELNADWTTPSNSTFTMVQQIPVNSFSGNFTSDWNNIQQPGTSQKLDGVSTVLMYRAQYRNFGGTQKLVCTHTIAESSTEAAIRWYELEKTTGSWAISQQGTYNPDGVSRWNASIAMNNNGEIGMGYSVSDGTSTYPGIRYCGQSTTAATGVMDIAEVTIWSGTNSQSGVNRWGDYSNISIDPSDGTTFWYTNEYQGSSTHGTRIAAFSFPPSCSAPTTQASNFSQVSATTSTMEISWNRGNGDALLVVAREGGSVNSNPISGNTYSANSIFGSGSEIGTGNFVIYDGTGSSVSISNLTPGSTYYFSFYEYFTADNCYLTPGYKGYSSTLGPPTISTNTITSISSTTAVSGGNISSNNGASVTAKGVCWNTTGSPTLSDSHTSDGTGIGSFSSNLSGLTALTQYSVRAYSTNSYGTSYGEEEVFTTACGSITSYPATQSFDSWTISSPEYSCTADGSVTLTDCWTNVTGDDIDWDIFTGSTASGSTGPTSGYSGSGNYLYAESSSCYGSTGSIISPNFDLSLLSNIELQFSYHMYGAGMGSLSIQVSTDGGTSWSSDIWNLSGDQGDAWYQENISLSSYSGYNNVVIRFKAVTGTDYTSDIAIDEVTVFSPCIPPSQEATSFSTDTIQDNELTINWSRGNGNKVIVIARQESAVDTDPMSGTTYNANASFGSGDEIGTGNYTIYNGTGTAVTVTSLGIGTDYHFAIHEYFDADNCYTASGLTGNATTTGTAPCNYCSASGNTSYQTSTTYVGLNTISTTSAKPGGYSDYTASSTELEIGGVYQLNIRVNTDGNYTTNTIVWIDWNQDCDFDDSGEEFDLGEAQNQSDSLTDLSPLTIDVPIDALLGNTIMRVSTKYSSDPTSCETGFDGEVEDYTINLIPASTTWNGYNTGWNNASNWPNNIIPNSSYEVSIPATPIGGNFPVIESGVDAKCYSITLEPGATITINGNLEVEN